MKCGTKYEGDLADNAGCPGCGSVTPREIVGLRVRCRQDAGCSLVENHQGGCVPWPEQPFGVEAGSSADYAPEVEGEPMQLDQKDGQVGVYEKYMVARTDGRDLPGEKHEECSYFVLDLTHDPHAVPALRAYAESCRITHPQLAIDIWATVGSDPVADQDGVDLSLWRPLPTLEEADHG